MVKNVDFGKEGTGEVVFRLKNWRECVSDEVIEAVIASDDEEGLRQLEVMPPVGFLGPDGNNSVTSTIRGGFPSSAPLTLEIISTLELRVEMMVSGL